MDNEKVLELLKTYSCRVINLCYEIVNNIKDDDFQEQVKIISYFSETFGTIKSDKSLILDEIISKQEQDELKDEYGKYVDGILEASLKKAYNKSYSLEEFYTLLWGHFVKTEMLETTKEMSFALYYVVIDKKIPYFEIKKGLLMSNEIYDKLITKNKDVIAKIKFVLANSFKQKTEEASIILDEIIELESYEEQVVVLSSMIASMRKETQRIYDSIREMVSELQD